MSLSASDKRDIAEVVNVVIEARNQELYSEIAAGFVEAINGLMEMFARGANTGTRMHLRPAHRP